MEYHWQEPFNDLENVTKLIKLYKEGLSYSELAYFFSCSENVIKNTLLYHKVPVLKRLTVDDTKIATLYEEGHSLNALSRMFEKSERVIRKVLVKYNITIRSAKSTRVVKEKAVFILKPVGKYDNILLEAVNPGHDYADILKKQGYKKPKLDNFNRIRKFKIKESPQ